MTRTAMFFAALAAVTPSIALAQGPEEPSLDEAAPSGFPEVTQDTDAARLLLGGGDGGLLAPTPTTEPAAEPAPEEDGYVEDGEVYEGQVEFCGGGGEESQVDLAYYEMEEGRLRRARRMLVTALREGAVEQWQRGYALATRAEVQLRLRTYGQAIVNYRKALSIDPDGVTETARVGMATALYMRGSNEAAHREARTAREELCSDQYSIVGCFGATAIVARTSEDATERQEALDALTQLRAARADLAATFDEVEQRLSRRRVRERS